MTLRESIERASALTAAVAAIACVLLDPVQEFADARIDAGRIGLSTAKAKGNNA